METIEVNEIRLKNVDIRQ